MRRISNDCNDGGRSRLPVPIPPPPTLNGWRGGSPAIVAAALGPFQFPSFQHLSAAVEEALDRAEKVEGLSQKSIRGYRYSFDRLSAYLRDARTERPFLEGQVGLQVRILEDWVGWLRAGGANHTTVNHYWRGLHALFRRVAARNGAIDPTSMAAVPRPGRPLPRFLTRAALEDVLRFVENFDWAGGEPVRRRNVAVVAVMGLGGLRLGEVLRLTRADVDLRDSVIRVRNGKGRAGGKSRTVYMPPALHAVLDRYVAARPRVAQDRLFLSSRGKLPMPQIAVKRLCETITRFTGIRVAPHMLRHTAATLLRQAGIPDRLSMEQLGHGSLAVLQRYSHVEDGELAREITKLDVSLS